MLEVASGSGEHALHFAAAIPSWDFQPSDPAQDARASTTAWRNDAALPNLRAPIDLDARQGAQAIENLAPEDRRRLRALLCINMIHISPWAATLGLLDLAEAALPSGSPLLLYGPYFREGHPTAPSNEAFDASLRERDTSWGIRQLEAVGAEAEARGLRLRRVTPMPANNLFVVLEREAAELRG